MSKQSVLWYETNLKNHKMYIINMKKELFIHVKQTMEQIARSELEIAWLEYQIKQAKEQNKTSFDDTKFLKKQKADFWIPIKDDVLFQLGHIFNARYDENLNIKIIRKPEYTPRWRDGLS